MRTVTILASDLDSNSLQRAHTFAQILQPAFNVHVVGHTATGNIWEPLRNETGVDYRPLTFRSALAPHRLGHRSLRRLFDGDLIVAHKAVNTSFGLALRARRKLGIPVLVDVEEWELGLLGDSLYWEFRLAPGKWFAAPNSPLYTRLLDRRIRRADAITVTNSFLQRRYGGTLIPHARDERVFTPPSAPPECKVLFLGSVRPHKGIDVLLAAWPLVDVPGASAHVVGTPLDDPGLVRLRQRAPAGVHFHGHVAHHEVPDILRTAAVFVIPQLAGAASEGQLPTKLIEAIAAGLPVVASAVGDIPAWLADGGGIVVAPGDPVALGAAIRRLLVDRAAARSCGENARRRFLRDASFAAVRPRLVELVDATIGRRGRRP